MRMLPHLRDARPEDLPALLALEARFPGDRLSARQFRYHLARGGLRVAEGGGQPLGYTLVLRRRDTSAARLYSLVVDPDRRGRGIGKALLDDAERCAARRGATAMRLEVRADNAAALALYRRAGYRVFARRPRYYEDGMAALRLQRRLGD